MGKKDQEDGIIIEDNKPDSVIIEDKKEDVKPPEVPFLEIDGEPITKEQAVAGYMKNKDYTTKTQELSTQKADLEKRGKTLDEYKAMADWFDTEGNKKGAEQIRRIINGEEIVPETIDPEIDQDDPTYKMIKTLEGTVAKMNDNFGKFQAGSKADAVSRAAKDIAIEKKQAMAKYDFLDDDDMKNIADMALSQDAANLVEVADKYVARLKSYSEGQTTKKYKEKEKNQEVPIDSGGGGVPASVKTKLGDGSTKRAFLETFRKSLKEE